MANTAEITKMSAGCGTEKAPSKLVAVVGMACRLPQAKNYNEFWDNLWHEVNSIKEIPPQRWQISDYYSENIEETNKSISKWCGIIDDIDCFDNTFFGITAKEAKNMDPQQRILLEETWHCIEEAGIALGRLQQKKTAVFVGATTSDYRQAASAPGVVVHPYAGQGNFNCVLANRLSTVFGFTGESVVLDCACAASLVALHQAKKSLLAGECDYAIAAGVGLNLHPWKYLSFSKARMLSPTGQCRAFDREADGYVPGDGVGVILLQRLADAQEEKNHIHAILKGTAVNHSGYSQTLTAPSMTAQREVILAAYKDAGVDPATIGYVEAHGTGTSLGDPIEVEALIQAFRQFTDKKQFCYLGSVKSNIGHLEAAAGMAGVIKVVLMMMHQKIPQTLHVTGLNPLIDFAESPFVVATRQTDWKRIEDGLPLRAGVSSFNFSGVNSHICLEEYQPETSMATGEHEGGQYFLLSAKSQASLDSLLRDWREFADSQSFERSRLTDICQTLLTGRELFPYRFGKLIQSKEELKQYLANPGDGFYQKTNSRWCLRIGGFSWRLSPIPSELAEFTPFARKLEELLAHLRSLGERDDLRGDPWPEHLVRACSFIVSFAYLSLLRDLGLSVQAVAGEELGFWVGLAMCGMANPADVLAVLCGHTSNSQLRLKRPELPFYNALNGEFLKPRQFNETYLQHLFSGLSVSEEEFSHYAHQGMLVYSSQFTFKRLIDEWSQVLQPLELNIGRILSKDRINIGDYSTKQQSLLIIAIISSLNRLNEKWNLTTKRILTDNRFDELLSLLHDGIISKESLIELLVSSEPNLNKISESLNDRLEKISDIDSYPLLTKLNDTLTEAADALWLDRIASSHLPAKQEEGYEYLDLGELRYSPENNLSQPRLDWEQGLDLKRSLSVLSQRGFDIKWHHLYPADSGRKLSLPTYAFEKNRFWLDDWPFARSHEPVELPPVGSRDQSLPKAAQDQDTVELLYTMIGQKTPLNPNELTDNRPGGILFFGNDHRLFKTLQKKAGHEQIKLWLVQPGRTYAHVNDVFTIRPDNFSDYQSLVAEIANDSTESWQIIHNWANEKLVSQEEALERQLTRGIYAIFHLVKAIMQIGLIRKVRLLYVISDRAGQPQDRGISGFFRVLRLENPGYIGTCLSVENDLDYPQLAELIWRELRTPGQEAAEVRYKDGERWTNVLRQVELAPAPSRALPFREKGVYVITGGAGGLGMIVAEHLARKVKARLILIGRSELDESQTAALSMLEDLGAEVSYLRGDISSQADAQRLIKEARSRWREINGVIHGAGVYQSGLLLTKTKADMARVMAAKVKGTVWLDEATKNDALDFFLMFSSVASLLGDVGLSDYAFANCFMDEFAHWRQELVLIGRRHGRTVAINWPIWQEGGIHAAAEGDFLARTGMRPLSTEQGLRFLTSILADERFLQYLPVYGDAVKLRDLLEKRPGQSQGARESEGEIQVDGEELFCQTQDLLGRLFSEELELPSDRIKPATPFEEYGIDSIMIHRFNAAIEKKIGDVPKTLLFEYKCLRDLAEYFVKNHRSKLIATLRLQPGLELGTSGETARQTATRDAVCAMKESPPAAAGRREEEIAIIGVSGRFSAAPNLDRFWNNLKNGQDCVSTIPPERWDCHQYYHPDPAKALEGKMYCQWGSFLEDADKFDPLFFGISPREADTMDPQERIFLETIWAVLEDAGYTLRQLRAAGESDVGVYAGVTSYTYQLLGPDEWNKGNYVIPKSLPWSIANRVSYVLNLRGPSMPVDTACSSSLTALHLACESLKKGECSLAIAGGVNLIFHPSKYVLMCQLGMLSAAGRCHAFGERGDGFVPGEGVGAVLLKPLSKAVADRDHIYAVIKASSINHGGRTNGYTVPDPAAQADLVLRVMRNAGISAESVGYIEAHGTGTSLGDPIELAGLTKAFRAMTDGHQFCAIGSVKTNIGHLESAAGIAGLIKVLLQMKHRTLVPSLHSDRLNPKIDWLDTPFYVQHELAAWESPVVLEGGKRQVCPRRAGVSSFGAGGANAHVILEEYSSREQREVEAPKPRVFVWSARNRERLETYVRQYLVFLDDPAEVNLRDMAYTMQIGREAMAERLAVVASSIQDLRAELRRFLQRRQPGETPAPDAGFGPEGPQKGYYAGNINDVNNRLPWLVSGEAGDEYLRILIENRNLPKLAELWVAGVEIDWRLLYEGENPARTPLPTYPFLRERYWIPEAESHPGISGHESWSARIHPLIDANVSTLHELKFLKKLNKQQYILADHVVGGKNILPGTACLEMAWVAGEIGREQEARAIREVYWSKPVQFEDSSQELFINLQPKEDMVALEIYSRRQGANKVQHCRGKLVFGQDHPPSAGQRGLDLPAIMSRCPVIMNGPECYQEFRRMGLEYGLSFQPIRQVWTNGRESLAQLVLPEKLEAEFSQYRLHPVLLDGAMQGTIGLIRQNERMRGTLFLPFSLREVIIYDRLPNKCFSYVFFSKNAENNDDIIQVDVSIVDERGEILVQMDALTAKAYQERRSGREDTLDIFRRLELGALEPDEAEELLERVL